MKNIKNRISEKLFKQEEKIELQSEKIDLGLVDDIKKLKDSFDKNITPVYKEISKQKSILRDKGSKAEKTLNKYGGEIKTALDKVERSAKDLGLNPKNIPNYSALKNLVDIIPDMEIVFKSVQ